jgi:hypothetical protein
MENFKNLKCSIVPYKILKKNGFDFNSFDFMADLVDGDNILKNAIVVENIAVIINDTKTSACIIDLRENLNLKVIKIDRSNIN